MDTGKLIVYTSADSVLQIAAHEDVIPIEELYHICEIARKETLDGKYKLGRIIARPFIGSPGNFERTANRHDYALKPFSRTVMDELKEDRKSTRLNSSHVAISYAVYCLKKKNIVKRRKQKK